MFYTEREARQSTCLVFTLFVVVVAAAIFFCINMMQNEIYFDGIFAGGK